LAIVLPFVLNFDSEFPIAPPGLAKADGLTIDGDLPGETGYSVTQA